MIAQGITLDSTIKDQNLVLHQKSAFLGNVVVVYHVTIVAIRHGLLKKFWPLVLGCVLRTVG